MKNERTSKSVAAKAGRVLGDKNSSPDAKSIAASALTQAGGEAEQITVEQAAKVITKALKDDGNFYFAYQSNIAMAIYDEFIEPGGKSFQEIANDAAKRFLDQWISQAEIE